MGIILTLSLSGWIGACSALTPDRTAPKSTTYHVEKPSGSSWINVPVGENADSVDSLKADMAFENTQNGTIISLNSICRKYNSTTLDDLTNNLVRGIDNRKLVSEKYRLIEGAQARDSLFEGVVDKVQINIRTVVLIKNGCTYDFIKVAIPERGGDNQADFEKFLASFKIHKVD
jgi:hypothetical protein